MRTFERFLNRRRIKNPRSYFTEMGITTNEQLESWCKASGVEPPASALFEPPGRHEPPPQAKAAKKPRQVKAAKKTTTSEDPESWHVPAAERPLKKPQKKRTAPKKKGGK